MRTLIVLMLGLSLALCSGCEKPDAKAAPRANNEKDEHDHAGEAADAHGTEAAPADAGGLSIPESVRQNLGITFAKAERRHVTCTIRLPGRFELLPSARREYHTVFPGRVEIMVRQYEAVEAGTVLYRLDAPEWLKMRQQLQEELLAVKKSDAEVAVAEATKTEAEKAISLLQQRIEALAAAEVRRAELDATLAEKKNSLTRLTAELRAKQAEHEAAEARFPLTLASAASLLGMGTEELLENVGTADMPMPRWKTIHALEVRAAEAGVVESLALTNGSWAEIAKPVLTTVNPKALRFRAIGLQADLGKLQSGLSATIVPPAGGNLQSAPRLTGQITIGLEAHPEERSIEVIVMPKELGGWARAGVSAFVEVPTDSTDVEELAVPVQAVIQDGLTHIFFRRDPKDPDKAIRVEADLGTSDGQWVVVNRGIDSGDEVVVNGVYELKLASSGGNQAGDKGHFHADGSFHEGKDKQ